MKKRLVLATISTIMLLLLVAPAANAVYVTGINPFRADPGTTVSCVITGTFNPAGSDPYFQLEGWTVIPGVITVGWDAGSAYVSFTIPRSATPGAYDLYTTQVVGGVTETDLFRGAFTVNDLAPHITDMSPGYSYAGDPDQSVIVTGYGFQDSTPGHQGSVVKFNGVAFPTVFHSVTELQVSFYYTCFQTPGIGSVTVTNVSDDWTSNSWPYTVIMPTPTLTSIDPASAAAGSGDLQITAIGTNFTTTAVLDFGGTMVTTYVDGPTRLRGVVPASLLTTARTVNVLVRNGSGGGAPVSGSQPFTITAVSVPSPVITSIEPPTLTVGDTSRRLTVHGSGFAGSSAVGWSAVSGPARLVRMLDTMFVSDSLLTATVSPYFVESPRTLYVVVVTGGAISAEMPFIITALGAPAITSLTPSTAVAAGASFDLKVLGSGFAAGAVVVWNATDLTTARTSATELHAQVPAALIAAAGSASVTVRNGPAGSPASGPVSFSITSGGGGGGTFAVTSLEPQQVYAGYVGPGLTLTVNGSGFVTGAHIWLGTHEKTATTFVSASRLTTTLLPADLASVGTIQVSVKNPPAVASPSTLPLAVGSETTDPTVTITGADGGWHNSPVTLTFVGSDSQSGVQKVQYRCPPAVGSWTTGTSYTVPVTTQGEISVSAQVFDWCNRVGTASTVVRIDTTKPRTDALNAVSVKRGRIAKLKFRVSEPSDLSPRADVTLQVKKGTRVVMTKTLSGVPMNSTQTYSFRVGLKKGSYRWYVLAKDLAGNRQVKADRASFKVR